MIDLAAEWRAALAALTVADELDLIDVGVPAELFRRCRLDKAMYFHRLIGKARIVLADNATYEPHPDGDEAFITPLRRQNDRPHTIDAMVPAASARWGVLLDMIAWHPSAPYAWARRCGDCGCHSLGVVEWQAGPIELHRSPFTWLCAGAVGLVPLDRFCHLLPVMGAGVIAEDQRHAAELARHLDNEHLAWFHETRGRRFFSWGSPSGAD